ncbi:potassium channel family protein [Oceanimonas sp. AH20CE76]|uniref:potassium channel family protein n=1 Tax=Oceanimonas sp. AH20CE76 TaxID=2977120 RepID=UPI0031FE4F3A
MELSISFIKMLALSLYFLGPVIILLFLIITLLALITSRLDGWRKSEALYWAFITALTVGYGDIRPKHGSSRFISIVIAILGIMLAGIVVAVTVEAASNSFKLHINPDTLKRVTQELG